MNRKSALVRWLWVVIEAVTLIGIGVVFVGGWPIVTEVWRLNSVAIAEAIGLFALMPLFFVGIIALDRWRSQNLRK